MEDMLGIMGNEWGKHFQNGNISALSDIKLLYEEWFISMF